MGQGRGSAGQHLRPPQLRHGGGLGAGATAGGPPLEMGCGLGLQMPLQRRRAACGARRGHVGGGGGGRGRRSSRIALKGVQLYKGTRVWGGVGDGVRCH